MNQSSANDRQVGGSHYRTNGEQHWDRQYRMFGPGYFIGCITAYVERYQGKNGLEDLRKAHHFIEKLIELESKKPQHALLRGATDPTSWPYADSTGAATAGYVGQGGPVERAERGRPLPPDLGDVRPF